MRSCGEKRRANAPCGSTAASTFRLTDARSSAGRGAAGATLTESASWNSSSARRTSSAARLSPGVIGGAGAGAVDEGSVPSVPASTYANSGRGAVTAIAPAVSSVGERRAAAGDGMIAPGAVRQRCHNTAITTAPAANAAIPSHGASISSGSATINSTKASSDRSPALARGLAVAETSALVPWTVAPPAGGRGGAALCVPALIPAMIRVTPSARTSGGRTLRASRPRGRSCLRKATDIADTGTRLDFDLRKQRLRASEHLAQDRRGECDEALGRERHRGLGVRERCRLDRELRAPDPVIHREHVADLIPGAAHIAFLVGADDARTQARGCAIAGIQVEGVDPAGVGRSRAHAVDLSGQQP